MAGSAQEVQIQTGWFTPEVNKMPQMATTSQRWDMIEMTNTTSLDMIKLQVWNVDGVLGSHILIHDMICIHMCYMYVHIYIYIYMPLKYMRVYIIHTGQFIPAVYRKSTCGKPYRESPLRI